MEISRVNGIGNDYAYLRNHRAPARVEAAPVSPSSLANSPWGPAASTGTPGPLNLADRNAVENAERYRPKDPMLKLAKRMGIVECQTCKNRQYADVSSDTGVSFKNAQHISPEAAFAVVSAHEQEHVSIAQQKAAANDNVSVSSSVRIFTSICPECGRVYVSGGETRTTTVTRPEQPEVEKKESIPYLTESSFTPKTGNRFDAAA